MHTIPQHHQRPVSRRRRAALLAAAVALGGLGVVGAPSPASAEPAVIEVTSTQDCALSDTSCPRGLTLRRAIELASTDGQDTRIVLQSGATYVLDACATGTDNSNATGDLDARGAQGLRIEMSGLPRHDEPATVEQTCPGERVLHSRATGELGLTGIRLTGGHTTDHGGGVLAEGPVSLYRSQVVGNGAGRLGGGLHAPGGLIVDSTFSGNGSRGNGGGAHFSGAGGTATTIRGSSFFENGSAVDGGALWFLGSATSPVRIEQSSFVSNRADRHAGAIGSGFSPVLVQSSTLHGNVARGAGGALYAPFDRDQVSLTIQASTISANTAALGSSVAGANVTLQANVLAEARSVPGTTTPSHCAISTADGATNRSDGWNFLDTNVDPSTPEHLSCARRIDIRDWHGTGDPQLGPLTAGDRPHFLYRSTLPGSPLVRAIPADAGVCFAPPADQLGTGRGDSSGCDVGAIQTAAS